MTRVQRVFRAAFTLWLLGWPILHMTSSRLGAFSSWRFAGWGMYATPYPSPLQSPIEVALSEPNTIERVPRPLAVRVDGEPVDATREGLRFSVTCSSCRLSSMDLSADGAREIASLARAARHLHPERSLAALARVVATELRGAGLGHLELRVRKSERFAEPLSNRYGFHHRDLWFGPIADAAAKP